MPLPEMTTAITSRALVCDRVTAYVQVHVQNLPANFLRSLHDAFGFDRKQTEDGGWGYWLENLTLGDDDIPVRIQASIINRETVGFTVQLSPLKALHRQSTAEINERAPCEQENWLPAADIAADNSRAVDAVARLAPTMRWYCRDLVAQILESTPPPERNSQRPRIASIQITLRELEMAYDFFSGQPNLTVDRFVPLIAALCPEVSNKRYPRSRYQRAIRRAGSMVEGYIHPNERIKLYVKAWPNRVRLELALSADRLRLHAHPAAARHRPMSIHTTSAFKRIYANVASHAANRFQGLMTSRLRLIRNKATAVHLYAELVRRLPNIETADLILDKLVSQKRLLWAESRSIIRPLVAAGILATARRHGIYPIGDRFQAAVELIASTPGFFSHLRSRPIEAGRG